MAAPLSIYMLVDALGWELVRDRGFLDDVLAERRWLVTVLGETPAAIPTLLTGTTPSQHGRWTRRYRDPAKGVLTSAPPFDVAELNGGVPSIFTDMREAGIPYECFTPRRGNDAELVELAAARAATTRARVLFVHLTGLDAQLREHLHRPATVAALVAWYEGAIRRVFDAARRGRPDVRLFVLSAYGVTPIRWTYDLRRDVEALGLRAPDDYLAVYDPTMARFWAETPRARDTLAALLGEHPCGTLMSVGELQRLGVWFDDARYYQLLFLMKPGMLLCPSDRGGARLAGMPGYHPSEPTADGTLMSTVPVDKAVDHVTSVRGALLEDLVLVTPELAA